VRALWLRKLSRRWVPHSLSECQKIERATQSRLLLDLLQRHQTADFNAIATEDESWFRYMYPYRTMSARPRSDVTSCVRSGTGTSKVMITILLLERRSYFWRFYQRVGNLTKTISSKKFYHHFLNRKVELPKGTWTRCYCRYGQPNVPWCSKNQSGIGTEQNRMSPSPSPFSRHQPVWLLDVWFSQSKT
jgi:hypothetical protein